MRKLMLKLLAVYKRLRLAPVAGCLPLYADMRGLCGGGGDPAWSDGRYVAGALAPVAL